MSKEPEESPFWQKDYAFGWFHEETNPYPIHDCLFVFIHGIRADQSWWEQKAQVFLSVINWSVDALAIRYPSNPFEPGSNLDAARILTDAIRSLESKLDKQYRHIFLVCHSNGGLVAREALQQDVHRLQGITNGSIEKHGTLPARRDLRSVSSRTRVVFDFAVPVFGGSPVHAVLTFLVFMVQFLLSPFLYLIRLITQDKYHFGINWIALSLTFFGTFALRRKFTEAKKFCLAKAFPFPFGVSIRGEKDSIAWTEHRSTVGYCKLRGSCVNGSRLCNTSNSINAAHSVELIESVQECPGWLGEHLESVEDVFFLDAMCQTI